MAFAYCKGLQDVKMPDSIESIGNDVFKNCSALPIIDNIKYADIYLVESVDKNAEHYNVKEGTKYIGNGSFANSINVHSFSIPNSVRIIGDSAFEGCESLTSISIPNSVENVGSYLCKGCTNLSAVSLSNSIKEIGKDVFSECLNLPVVDNIRYADSYLVCVVDKSLTHIAVIYYVTP